jgi:uncharacterized protein YciI
MLFAIVAYDKDNSLALRMATRPAHLDYLKETGALRLGGPFLDDSGDMIGSVLVFEAADFAAAKTWQMNEPYMKAGLFARTDLKPWRVTINHLDKTP